ncbi:uncharacterized protein ATC70_004771 [Mucor velutinosus]|uniref:GATA-type domain-containing protein n=1 Tax=Mucor velutinosus TaxID=708070 RepID=A0AAN7D9E0_9FUNG|nr:hypothetical protein ATC70_004771 [Mucor velutinosus]
MIQYHSFKINPASSSSSSSSSTTSPVSCADRPSTAPSFSMSVDASKQQKRFDNYHRRQLACNNNRLSPTSLAGPSFINALPINNIKLPSIKELENLIINPTQTSEPITTASTVMPQLPPIMSVSTTKRPFSAIVEQECRTSTTHSMRPLKRLNNEKRKLKPTPKQQCHSCNSTETPEWRKGPLGPRTLCNACGLIWTKLCKQNGQDNQNKELSATSDSSQHLSPLSSPTSHASSTVFSSSSYKSSINCQKYTLSFLLT